jgi:hypothetical protein
MIKKTAINTTDNHSKILYVGKSGKENFIRLAKGNRNA